MNNSYQAIMEQIVVPGHMNDSLASYANRIAVLHKAEFMKASPNTALLQVLEDALRVGWELLEIRTQPIKKLQKEFERIAKEDFNE
jgi:recombinational DNA repair ATPase RecF